MNIELVVQDSQDGKLYDFSEIASNIEFNTQIIDYPGCLKFDLIDGPNTIFSEGSRVKFRVNNQNIFFGYVFTRTRNGKTLNVTAYDQMRYLNNKDALVFKNVSGSQIFEQICSRQQLDYRVVNGSNYILPAKIFDNKSYYEIIQDSIDNTLIQTGQWFIVRDNFGTLEYVELETLRTGLVIGDNSLLNSYDYKSTIDEDTYNVVKVIHEREEQQRDSYITFDSSNITKWGRLQHFETLNTEMNEAQIRMYADRLLQIKNRVTKTLKVTCIGDLRINAGSGVYLDIADLKNEAKQGFVIVINCTHYFANAKHTMDLELEVV